MPRAIIIGGGVGGPAVAQFLTRAGWETEVFEARAQPDPYAGLFLNVATNGLSVLETLGLRERLLTDGHRAPRMVMWSGAGRELGSVPNGPAGQPERGSVVMRRAWLHQVIHDGAVAAGVPVTYGARLTAIDQTPTGVQATFADGRTAEGDLLIGADGVGSPTRRHIDPNAPAATYSGLVGLGGFARVDGLAPTPDTQHFVFGHRSFFGYLVRDDGTVYWFANPTRRDPDSVPARGWLAELQELHAEDLWPVPAILASAGRDGAAGKDASADLIGYPIHDLGHVPHWSRGRVVALGDAVHAISPSAGQGASLALEDAATLAGCLRDQPDHTAAFALYQRLRQPRAERIVRYARAINRRKRTTSNRVGIAIRDAMMPLFLRRAAADTRNDWLYNHTVDLELTRAG